MYDPHHTTVRQPSDICSPSVGYVYAPSYIFVSYISTKLVFLNFKKAISIRNKDNKSIMKGT